jgi:hypothetical protein
MISMVIVLFLVAVAISLFFGRFAETLTNRFRERSQPRQAGECLPLKPSREAEG